jgi:hypothetical protein
VTRFSLKPISILIVHNISKIYLDPSHNISKINSHLVAMKYSFLTIQNHLLSQTPLHHITTSVQSQDVALKSYLVFLPGYHTYSLKVNASLCMYRCRKIDGPSIVEVIGYRIQQGSNCFESSI